MKDLSKDLSSAATDEWVPFRIIIHKDVLDDVSLCQRDKDWYILDIQVPVTCAPSIIISSTNVPPDEISMDHAMLKSYEFSVLNSGIDDQGNFTSLTDFTDKIIDDEGNLLISTAILEDEIET